MSRVEKELSSLERLTSTVAVSINDMPTLLLALLGRAPRFGQSGPGEANPLPASSLVEPPSAPVHRTIGDLSSWQRSGRDQAGSGCSLATDQYGMSWCPEIDDDFRLYRQFQKG
jgi:hypothetical protein